MTTTSILSHPPANVKSPLRLDRDRGLCRTSKYLPLEDALRLCQRLENLSGILQPEVVNLRADGKARVQWQPLTQGSQFTDVTGFIARREATAAEQSSVMTFHVCEGFLQYACCNEDGHGSPHLVDLGNHECDCEDFRYRCLPLSERYGVPVPCHHLIELQKRLTTGAPLLASSLLAPAPKRDTSPEAVAQRAASVARNIGKDF